MAEEGTREAQHMSEPETDNAPGEDLLTIAEAASRLGVHEKRLRRLLTRTEYRDKTRTGTRTTRTGERRVSLLPAALVNDLDARLRLESDAAFKPQNADNEDADRDTDSKSGVSASHNKTETRTEPRQIVLSAFYERLLVEKDARITELAEDKAQLYRLLQEAQANLAREQALRSLPAPAAEITEATPVEEKRTEAAPWWVRLFGQKD